MEHAETDRSVDGGGGLMAVSTPLTGSLAGRSAAHPRLGMKSIEDAPMALEPPPTQASTASGRRPSLSMICSLDLFGDDALEVTDDRRDRDGAPCTEPKHVHGCRQIRLVHSRMVSETASFEGAGAALYRVDLGSQQAPYGRQFSACRIVSSSPMKTSHSISISAAAVAVATPCCPAPVSAMTRVLPIFLASRHLAQYVVDLVSSGVV